MKFFKKTLIKQLNNLYILKDSDFTYIENCCFEAYEKLHNCMSFFKKEIWQSDKLNPFVGQHYITFLSYLQNIIFTKYGRKDKTLNESRALVVCESIHNLILCLFNCYIYYETDLSDCFFAAHPVGSVIGACKYNRGFTFMQNCTVGANIDNNGQLQRPSLGKYVTMYSGSKIVGNSRIGDFVIIGADTFIKDQDIPNFSMVFGRSPNLQIITNHKNKIVQNTQIMYKKPII